MICSFCALAFRIEESRSACSVCPLGRLHGGSRSCRFVRCPRCGFENPLEPAWLRSLRRGSLRRRRRDPAVKSSRKEEHQGGS